MPKKTQDNHLIRDIRKSTDRVLSAMPGAIVSVSHEFTHGVTQDSDVIVTRVRERMSERLQPPFGILFHQAFVQKLVDFVAERDLSVFIGSVVGSGNFRLVDGVATTTFNTAVIVLRHDDPIGRHDKLRRCYPLFKVDRT